MIQKSCYSLAWASFCDCANWEVGGWCTIVLKGQMFFLLEFGHHGCSPQMDFSNPVGTAIHWFHSYLCWVEFCYCTTKHLCINLIWWRVNFSMYVVKGEATMFNWCKWGKLKMQHFKSSNIGIAEWRCATRFKQIEKCKHLVDAILAFSEFGLVFTDVTFANRCQTAQQCGW